MQTTVPLPSGSLSAHLASPDREGPWPGVVVLHEAFGLNDDIRRIAGRFAANGYLAVAPDLFSWASTPRCLVASFRDLLRRHGSTHERIDATRGWLAAREECTGRVGIVGFCMGGGFALLAAPRGYAAASVNYGLVPKDAEPILAGACPIVASYGAKDRTLRGHPARLRTALETNGIDHDIKEYLDVSHSFMNEHQGWVATLGRVGGFTHGPAQAEDAWNRTLAFFDRHLRRGA
ncbi:MAG: dienelactone hydrolase family protein [Actinomycetota bacterium]